jgi:hypothetical protein
MPAMRRLLLPWAITFSALACATTTPVHDGDGGPGYGGTGGYGIPGDGGSGGIIDVGEGGGSYCGDAYCDDAEDCDSCPDDCGTCTEACGDGVCDATTEDCDTCPDDCGACSVCGDGTCSPDETCKSCYQDCGICACMPDVFETNDTSPNATPVASGTDYCDLSVCANDVDWLEFQIASGFTAKTTFHEDQGDLDLEIFSAQTLNYITGSYSTDDDESVTLTGLSPGTYWARVYGKSGSVNPDYCFRVDAN